MLISNSIHSSWMKVLTPLQTPQNTVALINLASLVNELYYIAFLFKFFIWLPLKLNTVNIYYQFLFSTFWILCSLYAFEIISTFNLWNYGCFPFSVCMNCFYGMGSKSLSATLTVSKVFCHFYFASSPLHLYSDGTTFSKYFLFCELNDIIYSRKSSCFKIKLFSWYGLIILAWMVKPE